MPRSDARALIVRIALAQKFDAAFALAVARVESDDVSTEVSPKGAYGLMQLMPDTARKFGIDTCRPDQNVLGGIKLLRVLEGKYKNPLYVLAAYNAGNGALLKYHGLPPYGETLGYVAKVLNHYFGWKQNFGPGGSLTAATASLSRAAQVHQDTGAVRDVQSIDATASNRIAARAGVWKSGFVESFN